MRERASRNQDRFSRAPRSYLDVLSCTMSALLLLLHVALQLFPESNSNLRLQKKGFYKRVSTRGDYKLPRNLFWAKVPEAKGKDEKTLMWPICPRCNLRIPMKPVLKHSSHTWNYSSVVNG